MMNRTTLAPVPSKSFVEHSQLDTGQRVQINFRGTNYRDKQMKDMKNDELLQTLRLTDRASSETGTTEFP